MELFKVLLRLTACPIAKSNPFCVGAANVATTECGAPAPYPLVKSPSVSDSSAPDQVNVTARRTAAHPQNDNIKSIFFMKSPFSHLTNRRRLFS